MIVSFFLYLRPSDIKKLRQFQSVGRRSYIVGVRNDKVCVTGYWTAKISENQEDERKQLADVKELAMDYRQTIKNNFPMEQWERFGISDKRVIPHICYVLGFRITFVSLQLSLPLAITTDQAKRLESSVEI